MLDACLRMTAKGGCCFCCFTLTTLIASTVTPSAVGPSNIVLILADDQGWGDVGFNSKHYDHSSYHSNWTLNPPRMPNLDAMAHSENSIVFHRFYAGSAVCSPTRSALLTGRTPNRECISSAEGCGSKPAYSCLDRLPLPPTTFTIAEAAKQAGFATAHFGKWHLGDFFYKGDGEGDKLNPGELHRQPLSTDDSGYAYGKWPVSNPGMHGFDEWHSTEASASSSTTNCDCDPEWGHEAPGCVAGGGKWGPSMNTGCTNYWSPMADASPSCRNISEPKGVLAQRCVTNLTQKITGDDSEYIVDRFEAFVQRSVGSGTPFMALLWLHTVHEPHPSLPSFYHNYTDAFDDPAGDYLGTLTQMDAQIGRIRFILGAYGVRDETMVWFTADNGPHPAGRDRNAFPALSASNGLRQCKASLYEGGIRVPGILEWPAMIKQRSTTWHPSYVSDFMPTILEAMGVPHKHPDWAADGMSLMPLIKTLSATPAANDTTLRPEVSPLVFVLGQQVAIINNQWKLLKSPVAGQCAKEHGSFTSDGPFLFNLDDDPTEACQRDSTRTRQTPPHRLHCRPPPHQSMNSPPTRSMQHQLPTEACMIGGAVAHYCSQSEDLAQLSVHATRVRDMRDQMTALEASIRSSQQLESECQPKIPSPPPSPSPSPQLMFSHATGACLVLGPPEATADDGAERKILKPSYQLTLGACSGLRAQWHLVGGSPRSIAGDCMKLDEQQASPCAHGADAKVGSFCSPTANLVWVSNKLELAGDSANRKFITGHLTQAISCSPAACLGVEAGAPIMGPCNSEVGSEWTALLT